MKDCRALLLICLVVLCIICTNAICSSAATWYIKPDGTGDAPTIQAGIDSASHGDEVILMNGTYRGDGNRNIDFIGKAIIVRSASNDPSLCIIDGGAEVITANIRGIIFESGEDSCSVLQGIRVIKMNSGVSCSNNSAPIINYCEIIDNMSIGGIGRSNPIFRNCHFEDNSSKLHCTNSSPSFTDCYFIGNSDEDGGTVFVGLSYPSFTRCTFSQNRTGAVNIHWSSPTFIDCLFENNSGGGLLIGSAGVTLSNCIFRGNTHVHGGAISFYNSSGEIDSCIFENNVSSDYGGAIFFDKSTSMINNCSFSHNEANYGGAIGCDYSTCLTITNTLFSFNKADEYGGCIYAKEFYPSYYYIDISLINSTMANNEASINGGGLWLFKSNAKIYSTIIANSASGEAIYNDQSSNVDISCSDIYGNEGGDWTENIAALADINGNIYADPQFCDPASGDYSLNGLSPCLPDNHPDGSDCDLIGAFVHGCDYIIARLDLLPGICPNEIILKENGSDEKADKWKGKFSGNDNILRAALVGSDDFDVRQIDIASVNFQGIVPFNIEFKDVTRPVLENESCACTEDGPDGLMDLTFKCQKKDVALLLEGVAPDDKFTLTATGRMHNGSLFRATDCLTKSNGSVNTVADYGVTDISLGLASPNPFNPSTTIVFTLPEAIPVDLSIYDVQGKHVITLINSIGTAGINTAQWDGMNNEGERIGSGIYFYRLRAKNKVLTRKLVLIK